MTNKRMGSCVLAILAMLMPLASHADLYTAMLPHEKKDFERAIELYRELAELGRPEAQENLAVMYVNGEGVKRDNVLGYAWASHCAWRMVVVKPRKKSSSSSSRI